MDAITYRTPVAVIKVNPTESGSHKKYETCKPCCSKENEQELLLASMFVDLMSATIKQLGKQVKSLKQENAELRAQLDLNA